MQDGLLAGVVTRAQLESTLAGGQRELRLAELPLWRDAVHVHPDQPLEMAFERLSRTPGLLPVVSRANARHLEGIVSLEGILKAFAYSRPP